jgi:hypothetical protein
MLGFPALYRPLVLIVTVVLLAPATALASTRDNIFRDCQDGHIDGHYTQKQYADALANVPTDVDEYTDCRDVIRRAQLGAAGGGRAGGTKGGPPTGGPTGGAGTPSPPAAANADPLSTASPHERAAVERTRAAKSSPVQIAGRIINPTPLGYRGGNSFSSIPTPLLVVLLLIGAAAVAAGGIWLRARVLARRSP